MNWKAISVGALLISHAALGVLEIAADKHQRKSSRNKVIAMRTAEEQVLVEGAEKELKLCEDLKAREAKEMTRRLSSAKQEMNYELRRRDIYSAEERGLLDFKRGIEYDGKKQAIADTYAEGLASYKEALEYDTKLSGFEKAIEEAKEAYEKKISVCDAMGNDIPEVTATLKAEAEKVKAKAVNEAEAGIKALKDQVAAAEARVGKVRQDELQKLEQQVLSEKTRLHKTAEQDLKRLEDELTHQKNKIQDDIFKARTPAERMALHNANDNRDILKEQTFKDAERAAEIRCETAHHVKLAEWFNAHEVPKWVVAFLGFVPLLPLGYLTGRYCICVVRVIGAM